MLDFAEDTGSLGLLLAHDIFVGRSEDIDGVDIVLDDILGRC